MPFEEHHAGRPNLDLDAHRLAGLEHFALGVRVIRPMRKRQRRIELAMRCAEPAFGHRNGLTLLAQLEHVAAIGRDVADGRENIHVLGAARHPQNQDDRPGHLGVFRERIGCERRAH